MRNVWSRNNTAEFDKETQFHLDSMIDANVANGMTADEARRRALVDFGGREQVTQQLREVHTAAWFERLGFQVRSAWRFIRHSPSLASAVVVTLALGIGANSSVFSAIDAILLRPLPFPHGDQLVRIHQHDSTAKVPESFVSAQRLEDLNRLNSTFQSITGYYTGDANLNEGGSPERAFVAFVAPRFLATWGIQPSIGRDFTAQEVVFRGPDAVLVTDRFWRTHMGADPHAAGKLIHLGTAAVTVVGVLPATFLFPDPEVEFFEPSPVDAPYAQDRTSTWFIVIGRLKAGVTTGQAQADLARVQTEVGRQYPASDSSFSSEVQPLKAVVIGGVQGSLWLLYGAVTVLLLIACTNIAALLMARTTEREHEISIRFALGASRSAILLQLLSEVFVLACVGGVLGLLLASAAGRLLAHFAKDLPRLSEVGLDWHLVAYTAASTVAVTLLCGLAPALLGTRRTPAGSLASGGRSQVSSRGGAQWTLVGVQISLAVALLIASGLLLRTFHKLSQVDPGFQSAHVLTLHISAGWGETTNMGALTARVDRDLDGLRTVPGVQAAATSGTIPGNSTSYPAEMKLLGAPQNASDKVTADLHYVSAGYFATMSIPLVLGEACRSGMSYATAVVNQSFADRYLGGASAIGARLKPAADFIEAAQVRGIAADAREQGLNVPAQPIVYWCYSAPSPDPYYLLRVSGDPAAMVETIRRRVQVLEPTRSVFGVVPLDDHLADRAAETRLLTWLLTAFAITAVALVAIGLYGTVSYLGRRRRREIGLRLAMGAQPQSIIRRFMAQGLRVTAVGAVTGLCLGAILSRLLHSRLYGVTPLDVPTYAAVLLLILTLAVVAALIPAVRASRVDPMEILRQE